MVGDVNHVLHAGALADQHAGGIILFEDGVQLVDLGVDRSLVDVGGGRPRDGLAGAPRGVAAVDGRQPHRAVAEQRHPLAVPARPRRHRAGRFRGHGVCEQLAPSFSVFFFHRHVASGWNCSRVSWTRRFSANYTIFSLGRLTGMEAETRAKGYSEAERKSAMRYVCHVSSPCGWWPYAGRRCTAMLPPAALKRSTNGSQFSSGLTVWSCPP